MIISSPWTENVFLLFALFVALSGASSLLFLYRAYARYLSASEIFLAALEKLIIANNLDRAGKLCNAVPGSGVIAHLSRRLIKTAQSFTPTSFPEDRRGILLQALAEEESTIQQEERKLSLYKKNSIFWLLCAAVLLLLESISTDVSLIVLLGLLFLFYMAERMERTTTLHKALVIPKLVRLLSFNHTPLPAPAPAPPSVEQDLPTPVSSGEPAQFTLEISAPGELSQTHSFPKKSSLIKLGTDQNNAQVHLTGEGIGGLHCVLNVSSEKANLLDLGTGTGIKVNGERTTNRDLQSGDVIEVGRYTIKLNW